MSEPVEEHPIEAAIEAALIPLSKNRNFRLLWIGQVLSDLGSEFGALAYPLLILFLTHSPILAGVVGTVTSVAAFVVRLPAGSLADRLDRRKVMVVVDGVRAVTLGVMSILVAIHTIVWPVVLLVAIIDRLGDTLFTPASIAALPNIVDESQIEGAWAATEARQYAASLSGPALGGVLFSLGRALPFLGDTISYGVSMFTSSRMKGRFKPVSSGAAAKGLWAEAFDGLRVVWRHPLLRAVIVQAPLINFAFNGVVFCVILSLQHAGTSSSAIGLAEASIMVGGLIGAIFAPRFQGKFSLSQLVVVLTGGGAVLFALAAFISPSLLMVIPIAIPFAISPVTNAALFGASLRETPEDMRGRVNNALLQVATGLAAFSPLVAGLMVEKTSPHWAMGLFAGILVLSTVLALSLKGLRNAEKSSPAPS